MKQEKPQPLDLKEIEEEIIDRFNEHQPHELQEELDLIKEVLKQRLKSACEFYLRYKDNPELLIKEHQTYEPEIMAKFFIGYGNNDKLLVFDIIKYNEWLFKLTFKPILKNGEENEKRK